MQTLIKKWGNSAAVRIPGAVLGAAQAQLDQPVDVRAEGGRIIIEPLRPERFNLGTLVGSITDANRHDVVETGEAVGQEVW